MTDSDEHEPSDAEIMLTLRTAEPARFDLLVRRYRDKLLRVAVSKIGHSETAEDIVQETFLAVYSARETFNPEFSFRSWIWTILLNLCRRHYRTRRQSDRTLRAWVRESGEPITRETGLTLLLGKELRHNCRELLEQLPEPQADALRLRFFGELKFHEIAETMDCHLNAAKQRVKTGLARLAELIRQSKLRSPEDNHVDL
jgi:RNA polymerase sigma-70 factor, ECF subfamily